jgi:YVTN family beta-propeller protein
MEFRLLGPLEIWEDGRPLSLGGTKQRALLAILLLRANEVVSRDVLIDELWGERPPPSAAHSLEAYVSRLRKTLHADRTGEPILVTRPPGYMLRVGFEELDLHRFERLLEEGRRALATHAPERALQKLSDALSLWRGSPVGDLAFEPFAQVEVERLEELRLAALEERFEAELALGRNDALVPELQALVAQHPLRERLRGQLMLALYRSGRQAEALQVYREARGYFVEELGLEPGPSLKTIEQAILRQEEVLAAPERDAGGVGVVVSPSPAPPRPPQTVPIPRAVTQTRRRLPVMGGVAAAAALAITAAVAIPLAVHGSGDRLTRIEENALGSVSTPGGGVDASVSLRVAPTRIASGLGSLWVTEFDDHSVVRVDPRARAVLQTIPVGSGPSGVAAGAGAVWVANSLDGTVSRIDAATNRVVQLIRVGGRPSEVAFGNGSVWVASSGTHTIAQLSATSGRLRRSIELLGDPSGLAVGAGALWATSADARTVSRVDLGTGSVSDTISVGGGPTGVAVSAGAVWVANSLDGTVARIDPARDSVVATIPVGDGPNAIAPAAGKVWVGNEFGGSLSRLDPRKGIVDRTIGIGGRPAALTTVAGTLWFAVRASAASHRGGSLVLLNPARAFDSLDPAFSQNQQPVALLGMTNDGLVSFKHVGGSDGVQVVPDLAVSLPTPAGRGTGYRFRLRSGIRYSTGRPVRPQDVRYAFERLFNVKSPATSLYGAILGADVCARRPASCDLSQGIVADARANTVTFHLVRPDPDFLYKLALPAAYLLPVGTPSRRLDTQTIPATGPYRISRYRRGQELKLVRNPRFHEWSNAAQPDGYPDEIIWKLGIGADPAVSAIQRGKADWMLDYGALPAKRRRELEVRYASQLHVNPAPVTDNVILNVRVPPFEDVRVRRALNYAIDRKAIAKLYGGPEAARATCQILPPQIPGFRRYCPYTLHPTRTGVWRAPDLTAARRLVSASGTSGMKIAVLDTAQPRIFFDEGRAVVAALRRLGYEASLRIVPDAAFFRIASDPGNRAQVISGGWNAGYPAASEFIARHLSCRGLRSGQNAGRFCDPTVDRQIARAQSLQLVSPQQAERLWANIDRELVDRAVTVPLVTPNDTDFVSKRVGNYRFHPLWGLLIDQLWVR